MKSDQLSSGQGGCVEGNSFGVGMSTGTVVLVTLVVGGVVSSVLLAGRVFAANCKALLVFGGGGVATNCKALLVLAATLIGGELICSV